MVTAVSLPLVKSLSYNPPQRTRPQEAVTAAHDGKRERGQEATHVERRGLVFVAENSVLRETESADLSDFGSLRS